MVDMPSAAGGERTTRTDGADRLPDEALVGPLGAWVRAALPFTEADPAALLVSSLVACGAVVGRRPHLWAGDARQAAATFAVVVADTPKANRGLSWAVTRRLLDVIDPELLARQVRTGLGDGRPVLETLHAAAVPSRHGPVERPADPTRILVHDPSFVRTLGMAGRASSEIGTLLRAAWDGLPLELGHGRYRVERHHVGIVAHATIDQLAQRLSLTDPSVSFVNRFVFVIARRQRPLLDEGRIPSEVVVEHGRRLRDNLHAGAGLGEVRRSDAAEAAWREAYPALAEDDPGGLLGIMVARAARHVLRFALVYALADRSPVIDVEHVRAALDLWSYCRSSAEIIVSGAPSAPSDLESDLLAALRAAGQSGMTLSEQLDYFGRNVPARRLHAARQALQDAGLATTGPERRAGSGRPATVTRAVGPDGTGATCDGSGASPTVGGPGGGS
jgi:hypothetical protein